MLRPVHTISAAFDAELRTAEIPDYDGALNGLQVACDSPIRAIAAAVDASVRTIDAAHAAGANLLVVHHGLFWHGAQRIDGTHYERLSRLIRRDIALYSAHLPLDAHEVHGNSRLLARELSLDPDGGFAPFRDIWCGVQGSANLQIRELHDRLERFAQGHRSPVVTTPYEPDAFTRRWAICSGAGANRDTLREASDAGIDTLIVGEGPHWSAVDATDAGLTVMYAGHYATETLGVQSVVAHVARAVGVPWTFVQAPTGL